jgi:hypothetical protein
VWRSLPPLQVGGAWQRDSEIVRASDREREASDRREERPWGQEWALHQKIIGKPVTVQKVNLVRRGYRNWESTQISRLLITMYVPTLRPWLLTLIEVWKSEALPKRFLSGGWHDALHVSPKFPSLQGTATIKRQWEREWVWERETESPDGDRESTLECSMRNACVPVPLPQKQHCNERYASVYPGWNHTHFWNHAPAPEYLVLLSNKLIKHAFDYITDCKLWHHWHTCWWLSTTRSLSPMAFCLEYAMAQPLTKPRHKHRGGWNSMPTATSTRAWNFGCIILGTQGSEQWLAELLRKKTKNRHKEV